MSPPREPVSPGQAESLGLIRVASSLLLCGRQPTDPATARRQSWPANRLCLFTFAAPMPASATTQSGPAVIRRLDVVQLGEADLGIGVDEVGGAGRRRSHVRCPSAAKGSA